ADLVRHAVAEEEFMYPEARERLASGDLLVDQELAEHAEAERLMKELEGLPPSDARFDQLLGKLIIDVRHHIDEEERELLPKLQSVCPQKMLYHLGEKVLLAKDGAPTRPHPGAPDRPPANLIIDPGIGLIDKIRDAIRDRKT
ncbi:MAG: hemerythrin domain-containing protein, partial [Haloechinothrix sp.]